MLRLISSENAISPNETRGGTWDVFYWVRDLAALSAELIERGAVVVYGPVTKTEYGMKELAVRDPDGYVLGFGEQLQG
jgi:hypothetical protein